MIRLDLRSDNQLIMQRFPNFVIESHLQAVEIRENQNMVCLYNYDEHEGVVCKSLMLLPRQVKNSLSNVLAKVGSENGIILSNEFKRR